MSNLADLGLTLASGRGNDRTITIRRASPQGDESSDGTVGSDGADSVPDDATAVATFVTDATDATFATFGIPSLPAPFPVVARLVRTPPGVVTTPDATEPDIESGEL